VNQKAAKAKTAVTKALAAIDAEFALGDESELDARLFQQLPRFRASLASILNQLEADTVPPKNERQRYMRGHIITDVWPLDLALGTLILAAENRYEEI